MSGPMKILILSKKVNPIDYLTDETIMNISNITQESPRKNVNRKNRTPRSTIKPTKVSFKKKAESFDDAMRMKIVADLNKLSDSNYETISKNIDAVYTRISPEQKPEILKLIIENASKQHIFAKEYIHIFKDLTSGGPDDNKYGLDILKEIVDTHKSIILEEITNGETYDDFCEANKKKYSRIGTSVVLGEASNYGLIPHAVLAQHAMNLIKTMVLIRNQSGKVPRETTETQVGCVLKFFRIVAKTKIAKEGFQKCLKEIEGFLELEKKEKKLNPKSKFAIMDFIDDMKKLHTEETKKVYRPKMISRGNILKKS